MSDAAKQGMGAGGVRAPIVVRLEYSMFGATGELIEAPGPDGAFEFILGVGHAPPAIERAVEGLALGDTCRVELTPGDAFGERDEQAMLLVDRDELPEGAAIGDELEAEREDGETVFLRVVELDDEMARLDANHPLAGQKLALELRVTALRLASPEELEAAMAELADRSEEAPDVLVSRLLHRDRFTPPRSG